MTGAPYYRRPSRFRVRIFDPLIRLLLDATGLGGRQARVLSVRGRISGRWYRRPVILWPIEGDRYIVSMWGDSQWACNLRAGVEARLRSGRHDEAIRAIELVGDEKLAFVKTFAGEQPRIVRRYLEADPAALGADDLGRLVERFPVFRIERSGPSS